MTREQFENLQINDYCVYEFKDQIWLGKIIAYNNHLPIITKIYANMINSVDTFCLEYNSQMHQYDCWTKLSSEEEINKYYKLIVFQ